jgi:hypothetical protein
MNKRQEKIIKLFKASSFQPNINRLEDLAQGFLRYIDPNDINYTKNTLEDVIYDYYTLESSDIIHDEYKRKTKEIENLKGIEETLKYDVNAFWSKIKSELESIASQFGWTANTESPEWFQLERIGRKPDNSNSHKIYLTFNKFSPDGKLSPSLYENYMKLSRLLRLLAGENFAGEVTFKVGNNFLKSVRHKDSVVIHFKNIADKDKINSVVGAVGFDLTPREDVGRTDSGVDVYDPITKKKMSDSQMAAKRALANIEANKDFLERLLKNPSTRASGLSGLNKILNDVMTQSSHRTN